MPVMTGLNGWDVFDSDGFPFPVTSRERYLEYSHRGG